MNWQAITFDWNHARAFLVTAEEGTLSAAARALGLTQPTLGRQVAALEEELKVTLFERAGRSLTLTQSGLELLEHVRGMGTAANHMALTASGQSQAIEGRVCITSTEMMATYHLPPIIKKLRQDAPGIELEIVASNDVRDLTRREADIAIRHARPEQPDLIAKLVGESTGHFYATRDFLDIHGRPETAEDLAKLAFVGFEDTERVLQYLNPLLGLTLTKDNFMISTASGTAILEMVKHGLGVGIFTKQVAVLHPTLKQIMADLKPIPVPVWLVTHRELHTSRRIRLVYDFLATELALV